MSIYPDHLLLPKVVAVSLLILGLVKENIETIRHLNRLPSPVKKEDIFQSELLYEHDRLFTSALLSLVLLLKLYQRVTLLL